MPNTRVSDALQAKAQAVAARGSLLFHLALAEALAGDVLAGRPPAETVGGWALDVGADGYEAVAVGLGERPEVQARVTFAADGSPIVEEAAGAGASPRASPRQEALARAREGAGAHGSALGGRWLALPVPPPRDLPPPDRLEAWLIRLPERPQDLVAGPHWRLEVATADGAVVDARPACGADRIFPDVSPARGDLCLAHEEDDVPSPVHVMLSLRHAVPLEVRTPRSGLRWRVAGETVRRLATDPRQRDA